MPVKWRDLLLMAGYHAPKDWSGHKCKKVLDLIASGDERRYQYLDELVIKDWAIHLKENPHGTDRG